MSKTVIEIQTNCQIFIKMFLEQYMLLHFLKIMKLYTQRHMYLFVDV